jgi:NADH-quinone oxidoreductase subunit M
LALHELKNIISSSCIFICNELCQFSPHNYTYKRWHFTSLRYPLFLTVLTFIASSLLWFFFDKSIASFQYLTFFFYENDFSIVGIDGISLFFILLTAFLLPLCVLTLWNNVHTEFENNYALQFSMFLILIALFLALAFSALNVITFFIFFECTLLPIFFIIGVWGSKTRRVKATFYLILYTLFGSIFLYLALFLLLLECGNTSFIIIYALDLSLDKQITLAILMFLAFAVKIPLFPLHIWLPEAHVEAPTAGSVILAGLLLKLGGYGLIRIFLPLCYKALAFFLPLVYTLTLLSILYASLTTLRQVDLKRIVAYSSIAHMNLVVLGIFSCNLHGIQGAIFLMLSHGLVSSALFFLIGFLYDKYHTKQIYYYGGVVQVMPVFSIFFLLFCLANFGFPGTSSFIGELLLFVGILDLNKIVLLIAALATILCLVYTMFMYNRIVFGTLNTTFITAWQDLDKKEIYILSPILILVIIFGVFPNLVLDTTYTSSLFLVESVANLRATH